MNINKLLLLLTEGKDVNEINKKLKGKVDAHMLETMAALMKKGKYDNIAMAMFKALQEWKDQDEQREFILKRPKLVYAALKEAGKGNSNFNPENDLNLFKYSDEEPMKFWANYRGREKERKESKPEKRVFGLDNARTKELKDSFLFFPRNFKFEFPKYGFRLTDTKDQYEDLKALSRQIAAKDTSDETYNGGSAKDNHWCVASDNPNWFNNNYKGRHKNGFFVVIVNKNKDGSPNWNDRYLLWVYPQTYHSGDDEYVDADIEIADKFNRHEGLGMLPKTTADFVRKNLIRKAKRVLPRGEEQMKELRRRAEKAYYETDEDRIKGGWRKKVNTQSPIFKNYIKILRFLRNEYNKQRPVDDVVTATTNALRAYIKKGMPHGTERTSEGYDFEMSNGGYDFKVFYNPFTEKYFVDVKREDEKSGPQFTLTADELKQVAQNFDALKKIKYDRWRDIKSLQQNFKSKAYTIFDTTPSKKVKDVLLNNELAMSEYEALVSRSQSNDEIREFNIGPYFYLESRDDGFNTVYFLEEPWDKDGGRPLGDLNDDNIVDKVKKVYAKEVASKPAAKVGWYGGPRKIEDTFPLKKKPVAEGSEKV